MRFGVVVLILLSVAFGATFGALNSERIAFDFYFVDVQMPKGAVLIAALLLGWILGGLLVCLQRAAPAKRIAPLQTDAARVEIRTDCCGFPRRGRQRRMSELALLFLLLPIAAFSGWYVARRGSERTSGARVSELSSNYFRGLNYLLNEQQDKAIEVFLKLAEYNRDTVETHLALGNLFRRRGEVDRAIRVHQNLIARPSLTDEEKTVALLELGEDYMRAGLLDRAETLFSDLVAMDALASSALTHLVSIYQHERDWIKAIDNATRLEAATGESCGPMIAQFHCELAEQARARSDWVEARGSLDAALAAQGDCVRASMILGHIEAANDNFAAAIEAFEHVAELDVDYVPEILSPLLDCYAKAQSMQRAEDFLLRMTERHQGVSPVLALARLYTRTRGEKAAVEFLTVNCISVPRSVPDGIDRHQLAYRTGRRARKPAYPARPDTQVARGAGHVPLRPLWIRCQGTPLAVPELQELEHDQTHPQRRRRVTQSMGALPAAAWIALAMCAIALSSLLVRISIGYAQRQQLIDHPGQRRSHKVATPRGGGIGIVVAALAGLSVLAMLDGDDGNTATSMALIGSIVVVACVGWIDDHQGLGVGLRLFAHGLAAVLLGLPALGLLLPGAADNPAMPLIAVVWLVGGVAIVGSSTCTISWTASMDCSPCRHCSCLRAGLGLPQGGRAGEAQLIGLFAAATLGFLPQLPACTRFLGDVCMGALGLMVAVACTGRWRQCRTHSGSDSSPVGIPCRQYVTLGSRVIRRRRGIVRTASICISAGARGIQSCTRRWHLYGMESCRGLSRNPVEPAGCSHDRQFGFVVSAIRWNDDGGDGVGCSVLGRWQALLPVGHPEGIEDCVNNRIIAKVHPRLAVVAHDLGMVWVAWVAITSIRWSFESSRPELGLFGPEVFLVLFAQGLIFWMTGLYKGLWRFASLPDLWNILRAATLGALAIALTLFLYNRLATVPRTVLLIYPLVLAVLLGIPRLAYRYWKDSRLDFLSRSPAMRVLVLGAGRGGDTLVRGLVRDNRYRPVGMLDDNSQVRGARIHGVPVLGTLAQLPELARETAAQMVLIAMPSATSLQMQRAVGLCEQTGLPFRTMPRLADVVAGRSSFGELKEVAIEDLLGREQVQLDWTSIRTGISGSVYDPAAAVRSDPNSVEVARLGASS